MTPRLKNWKNYPPQGGWGMVITIGGQNFNIQGSGPVRVVNSIAEIYRRNGIYKGDQPIWDYCNAIWCKKSPDRCGGVPESQSVYIPSGNTSTTPTRYGSKLWGMLDSFGMSHQWSKKNWSAAIEHISILLSPSASPATGCSDCNNEWITIITKWPPNDVNSPREAARWVFQAHNSVNARINKPQMIWEKAVLKNNWEI